MLNDLLLFVLLGTIVASCVAFAYLWLKAASAERVLKEYGSLQHLRDLVGDAEHALNKLENKTEEYTRALHFLEQHPTLQAESEQLAKDIVAKESQYGALAAQVRQAETELKTAREQLGQYARTIQESELELANLKRENQVLAEEKAHLEASARQTNETIAKQQQQQKQLASDEENLKQSVGALEARQKAAESWLRENGKKLEHRDDLERELKRLERDKSEIANRIEQSQRTLQELLKAMEKGLERLEKMNLSGVQTLRISAFESLKGGEGAFHVPPPKECDPSFGPGDELAALETVKAHFQTQGFEVPDRLLYAFHTSLKTSDSSSLTVMAGVSGTGKSAIPKLYAEAMGIFFRPLAIEPRWDSPKDLLGFFNYVTNRYEPTPLARAMFQFQGLWDKTFAPDVPLDQYLFMPMLDEMNLARIEYYFSDFLSKLELRRLVGDLTRESVPLIGLEVFSGFKGILDGVSVREPPVHLFANRNTLFVGTMNEDETTQSLSDKVIDRANVLYFGRPRELRLRGGVANAAPTRRAPLEYQTWKRWCREVDEVSLGDASRILHQLNERLSVFNRSFAHRTFQAMLAYVANYPQVSGALDLDLWRRALADQIAMRIMPKLRGIELTPNRRTLEEVGEILRSEVCDQELVKAFERAKSVDEGSGFFRWSGLDWCV